MMSSKEIALELITKLPDEVSLTDIAHEIEFVAGIRKGTEELDRGEGVPAEKVFQLIGEWAKATK